MTAHFKHVTHFAPVHNSTWPKL